MTREEYDKAIETREIVAKADDALRDVLERYEKNPKSFLRCLDIEENYDCLDNAKYVLGDLSSQLGFQIRMVHTKNLTDEGDMRHFYRQPGELYTAL